MTQLHKILKELKLLGVSGVKQSTEDEGSSFEDIKFMRKITKEVGIKLNVKIGGCEAKNDINFCKRIKVDSIIAPMVESSYALKKFVQYASLDKNCLHFFMLETQQSFYNVKNIINSNFIKSIDGVVIGRSDFAGSLGYTKDKVNSDIIFKKIESCLVKIKRNLKKKFIFKMGGSMSEKSQYFASKLFDKNLLHFIETRNIEIKLSKKSLNNIKEIIPKAFEFEMLWLEHKIKKNKKKKDLGYKSDLNRIREIKKRMN